MIAACPKCGTRYRIDGARVGPAGAKLRCSRCEVVFRVIQPPAAAQAAGPPPPPPPAAVPLAAPALHGQGFDDRVKAHIAGPGREVAPDHPQATNGQGKPDRSEPQPDHSRIVLVADPEPESAKATANALSSWGFRPILAHDGVEAILTVQRTLPRVVILDAALPKMFGFQVCELMKRNQSLREIAVILIGAIHHKDRYRRPPNELYGADAYIERPELPRALHSTLEGLGLFVRERSASAQGSASPSLSSGGRTGVQQRAPIDGPPPNPSAAEPSPPAFSVPGNHGLHEPSTRALKTPSPPLQRVADIPPARMGGEQAAAPMAAATAPATAETSQEFAQAERLARIIVSDIVLYNQEKFDAAAGSTNVVGAMQAEMEEARGLFAQRVDSSIRSQKDFLVEELVRVARARGMR